MTTFLLGPMQKLMYCIGILYSSQYTLMDWCYYKLHINLSVNQLLLLAERQGHEHPDITGHLPEKLFDN